MIYQAASPATPTENRPNPTRDEGQREIRHINDDRRLAHDQSPEPFLAKVKPCAGWNDCWDGKGLHTLSID